jgi:hypothetical protein
LRRIAGLKAKTRELGPVIIEGFSAQLPASFEQPCLHLLGFFRRFRPPAKLSKNPTARADRQKAIRGALGVGGGFYVARADSE